MELQDQMASLASALKTARETDPNAQQHQFIAQSIPLFARLKALHRHACLEALTAKASAAEHRNSMDAASLELQNLVYEKQHLEQEIRKCREYISVYEQVPLHSEEEFNQIVAARKQEQAQQKQQQPPSEPEPLPEQPSEGQGQEGEAPAESEEKPPPPPTSKEVQVPDASEDPHGYMLARLQFELQERQRLEAARKELLAQKGKLTKDNADKKAALDLLDKQLEDFITSAREIQKNMTLV